MSPPGRGRRIRDAARALASGALALAAFGLVATLPASPAPAAEARRVVLVSVDGLMPDCYVRADALGMKVPNLRRLMREGAWARGVVGVLPTVTYPSHTTLITGVLPRVHGIGGNHVFDPLRRSGEAWQWFARDIRVPTLVSAAKARWLTTASVSWPVSVGLGTDWNVPEFWRPGSSHAVDLELLDALSTPHLLDDVAQHRGRPFGWPVDDRDRVDAAVFILDVHRPHLLLLHIFASDSAQHEHGPLSPEAKAAIEESDASLGRLRDTLERDGLLATTVFAVVSDHGFLPVRESLRPNVLLKEAGLITVDAAGKPTGWRASFQTNGGTASLVLKDPGDREALARVRTLVEAKQAEPGSGIGRVLDADGVAAMGGPAEAALVLDAREGFGFADDVDGPWASASRTKGNHGYAPDRPEMNASFLVAGPGLGRAGDLGVVPMTAIAPTLARALGVSLGPQADAPLPLFE
jgi:predicted AlkP superfamily pyrophosphatase or phosphodiesterase